MAKNHKVSDEFQTLLDRVPQQPVRDDSGLDQLRDLREMARRLGMSQAVGWLDVEIAKGNADLRALAKSGPHKGK